MILQRTIKTISSFEGVGLHSGKNIQIRLVPAPVNFGIAFCRVDLPGEPLIHAEHSNIIHTQMATTIGNQNCSVSTIEHLMAAIAGLRIDNLLVEINGPEVPILDGSAQPFFELLEKSGKSTQLQPRSFIKILKKIEVRSGEKWAAIEPSEGFTLHSTIEWDHPAIGFQEFQFTLGITDFDEISKARTFGFLRDVEALKKAGLIKGGSLDNAVVLDEVQILNPEGLRYPDEFVRHKTLDALGDLRLAKGSLLGHVRLHRSGHELHQLLLAEIFSSPANYEHVTITEREETYLSRLQIALAEGLVASLQ